MSEMDSAELGWLMWAGAFVLSYLIRRWALRGRKTVSRNTQTGAKWEQVAPMDECFDDLED
jgi:hypothetical protein